MNDSDISFFLSSLTENLSKEETALLNLQSLIAAEISIKRQTLGYSQKQFAEKMHVTQALVSKWESGDTNYTLKTLVQIAEALDIRMQSPYILPPPAAKYSGKSKTPIVFSDYAKTYYTGMSTHVETSYTSEDSIPEEM